MATSHLIKFPAAARHGRVILLVVHNGDNRGCEFTRQRLTRQQAAKLTRSLFATAVLASVVVAFNQKFRMSP